MSAAATTSTPSPNGGAPPGSGPGGSGPVSMLSSGGNKVQRRGSGNNKGFNSRSYPRGIFIDFRKQTQEMLLDYVHHHGVPFRQDASHTELAVVVGRHFEGSLNIDEKDEQDCIQAFLLRLEYGDRPILHRNSAGGGGGGIDHDGGGVSGGSGSGGHHNEYARNTAVGARRHRGTAAARPGEQVAAKVTRTDENGSWILASVQRFYPETETYDVQDEDDTSKLIRLPWNHVIRLSMGTEGTFEKGTDCMAIFPETTSFYRAKVSKNPVWELDNSAHLATMSSSSTTTTSRDRAGQFNVTPVVKEVIVKFEDDEDGSGKTPHRRVPARYVIPIPADYFYDEIEDVDMSLVDQGNNSNKALS